MAQASFNQSQSLADWLCYLEQIHPQVMDLGLERVGMVADRLGLRTLPSRVVTVGGTNGKGTTCALLEAIYSAAGYSVGVYSSPHLLSYNERVRIGGINVSDEALCRAFQAVDVARQAVSLTFFEFGTLAALWLFREAAPDLVLLEVGLGGRLDATNLIESDVAVVTTIALDHCDWLGHTREAIAIEKAGIYRPGKSAISGEPEPPSTLAETANSLGARFYQAGVNFGRREQPTCWSFYGLGAEWAELPYPTLPLDNAVTALAVCTQLDLPLALDAVRTGLLHAQLVGRLQRLRTQPHVLIDVAHNPHSAHYLAQQLSLQPRSGRRLALCGMLKDKDIKHTLAELTPLIDEWWLADLEGPRAAKASDLAAELMAPYQSCYPSVVAAYRAMLREAKPEDMIIVFGSFYTVADVLAEERKE